MTTYVRVNVSDALIAQAKRQVEAARFRRAEQQQLRAAGATIAAAVAQKRQSPADPRSFWQVQRKRPAVAEQPIANSRKKIAFITFWLRGSWYGVITNGIYDPLPECRITVAVPSRNYVSDFIDLTFDRDKDPGPYSGNDHLFVSSTKTSVIRTARNTSYKDLERLLGEEVGGNLFTPDLAGIPAFANGSVSEFKIESKYLIPINAQSRIFLTWGKLGQYTNTVELPSSLPDVFTYTMTWRKQPQP